ncbi:Lysyl oxidase 3 [Fasciola gigantica]|uniref:Lysyl oxidase 3 n=1 Tax=Fasciola gigantica TaxID=46835 RepID=A0A504Y9S5_FASGI|nr:Lysyl oxidase 3 [Fasciola gigantica]
MHQIVLNLIDYPVTTSPTSTMQVRVAPNATIGPSITPATILPGSGDGDHLWRDQTITVEELIIYDSPLATLDPVRAYSWRVPSDLARLPLISSTNRLTLEFRVRGIHSGSLLFAVQTHDFQHAPDPSQRANAAKFSHRTLFGFEPDVRYFSIANFRIEDSVIDGNQDGVRLNHYHDPVDRDNRQLIRHAGEVFSLVNTSFR